MKLRIVLVLGLLSAFALAQDQPKKMVSIPEDQLTEQQKATLKIEQADSVIDKAHGWVGIGKELGQAFDGALGSLTTRSNEFANTPVGRFAMIIVAWKVMGQQAGELLNAIVHVTCGLVEMVLFVPIFLWSYKHTCLEHSVLATKEDGFWGKKTYTLVKPETDDGCMPLAQVLHWVSIPLFVIAWALTTFTY